MLSQFNGEDVSIASRISVADAPDEMIFSKAGWNWALVYLVSS
jgi:hypothetical protein